MDSALENFEHSRSDSRISTTTQLGIELSVGNYLVTDWVIEQSLERARRDPEADDSNMKNALLREETIRRVAKVKVTKRIVSVLCRVEGS